jgi:biopolymer transport protein ExbD
MAATHQGDSGDLGFQIAPMVDVIFVLLIFFMACVGIREKVLDVPVPGRGGSDPGIASIFVDIDPLGDVSVNGAVLAAANEKEMLPLREFLGRAMRTSPEDSVVIRPSGEARHERVLAVVDTCRAARVRKLVFGGSN